MHANMHEYIYIHIYMHIHEYICELACKHAWYIHTQQCSYVGPAPTITTCNSRCILSCISFLSDARADAWAVGCVRDVWKASWLCIPPVILPSPPLYTPFSVFSLSPLNTVALLSSLSLRSFLPLLPLSPSRLPCMFRLNAPVLPSACLTLDSVSACASLSALTSMSAWASASRWAPASSSPSRDVMRALASCR